MKSLLPLFFTSLLVTSISVAQQRSGGFRLIQLDDGLGRLVNIDNFNGSVGIGTSSPNSSALLEVNSDSRGFLLPRMSLLQRDAIVLPSTGLMIFNNSNNYFEYNFGTPIAPQWVRLLDSAGVAQTQSGNFWRTLGNSGVNPAVNFIGTTDPQDLIFKTNGNEHFRVTSGGNLVTQLGSGLLRSTGGTIGLGTVNLNSGDVSGTLQVTNGGTGLTSIAAGSIILGNGSSPLSTLLPGTNGYVLTMSGGSPQWTNPSAIVGATAWLLGGNTGLTNLVNNFMGTTDNIPVRIVANRNNVGQLSSQFPQLFVQPPQGATPNVGGRIGINNSEPMARLHVKTQNHGNQYRESVGAIIGGEYRIQGVPFAPLSIQEPHFGVIGVAGGTPNFPNQNILGTPWSVAGTTGIAYGQGGGGTQKIGVFGIGWDDMGNTGRGIGGKFVGLFTGNNLVIAINSVYGIIAEGTSTSTTPTIIYGVHSTATGQGAQDTTYSGYFDATAGLKNYAVYADRGTNFFRNSVGISVNTPLSTLHVNGSQSVKRTGTAINYNVQPNDYLVAVTNTAAPRTVTLPSAVTMGEGKVYVIKDESGGAAVNNITINPQPGQTINGAPSATITTNFGVVRLYSNGANWFIM